MPALVLELAGAYGRTYVSFEAAILDWQEGKEFVVQNLCGRGKHVALDIEDDLMFLGYPILAFRERPGGRKLGYYSIRLQRRMLADYSTEELDEFCQSVAGGLKSASYISSTVADTIRQQSRRPSDVGTCDACRERGSDAGESVPVRQAGQDIVPSK